MAPFQASVDQRIAELEATLSDREDKLREAVALYEQEKHQLTSAIHRIEREAAKQLVKSQESFLASFLEVLDDVDRARKVATQTEVDPAIREGLNLISQRFLSKLHEHGVERMHTSDRFDPTCHEAIAMAAVKDPAQVGAVVEVVAQGYRWGDKVLRPARVIVGKLAALVLLLCVATRCGGQAEPIAAPGELETPTEPEHGAMQAEMQELRKGVMQVYESVIYGDLENARSGALWLEEQAKNPVASTLSSTHRGLLIHTARELASATQVSELGERLGPVLQACGSCHSARGKLVDLKGWLPALPPQDAQKMLRHDWAVLQLSAGLFGPSNEHWSRGAKSLARADLDVWFDDMPASPTPSRNAQRISTLAAEAEGLLDPEARSIIYGKIMTECVGCHENKRPQCNSETQNGQIFALMAR